MFLFLIALLMLAAGLLLPEVAVLRLPGGVLAGLVLVSLLWRRRPRALVDGSNVMHWNGGTPRIDTVRAVVAALTRAGYRPGVVFDANAGYKLQDRYMNDRALARALRLPAARVLVVGRGTPADPILLEAARDMRACVVSNDRFRDWRDDFPELEEEGRLIRGGFRDGKVWLSLDG